MTEADLTAAARACARAEFAKWNAILTHRDARVDEIGRDERTTSMFRRMAVNAVALEIAQTLHVSEQQVWRVVEQGRRLRDDLPAAWTAFGEGRIDAQKASILAVAVDRTTQAVTRRALDRVVVDHATTHTPSELRRWVDRLIDRLEPTDLDEADAERARRNVSVGHTHHGMSWINAYLPSTTAVAIMKRLRSGAAELDDDRTRDQKQADLFASWLTNATGTECDVSAEIAVVVEASALAGVTDTPGIIDGEAGLPARWALELATSGTTLWTRLHTDPSGHVLDVTHLGYQPPESLRRAIRWRDMTCRISGCHARAADADLDHHEPWADGGETSGRNLRALCRRHHGIKGHGLLPADAYSPPEVHVVRLPTPTITIDYVAA